jgi:hypothetical protein
MKMKIKRLLMGILTLPISIFLLLPMGIILLMMRLYNIRLIDESLYDDYKVSLVDTATFGLLTL